jgi:hypothetical protein
LRLGGGETGEKGLASRRANKQERISRLVEEAVRAKAKQSPAITGYVLMVAAFAPNKGVLKNHEAKTSSEEQALSFLLLERTGGSEIRLRTALSARLTKKMEPYRPAGGPEVHCWSAETAKAEAETIADTIQELQKKGYRYKDIAILYRSVRTSSPPLIEVLKDRGIPFRCAGRTGLFLQPEASAMGKAYAWFIDNDWKNERYGEAQQIDIDQVVDEFQDVFADGKAILGSNLIISD